MNLVADESVQRSIIECLRGDGHAVLSIAEMDPGVGDDEVLEQANSQAALLLTTDKDFGELVFRLGKVHAGVILLRLKGLSPERKAALLTEALRDHADKLPGSFAVLTPGAVRIRSKLSPSDE